VAVGVSLGGCPAVTNGDVTGQDAGLHRALVRDLKVLKRTPPPVSPKLSVPSGAPACAAALPPAPALTMATTANVPLAGAPFGVASTKNGRWSFVAETETGPRQLPRVGSVAVLGNDGLAPRPVRVIGVSGNQLEGAALTPDGRYLLAAGSTGAYVISTHAAETGTGRAVVGHLTVGRALALGAIEVAVSDDSRYVFISEENTDGIAVFDLRAAIRSHFHSSGLVGVIPTGIAPVGLALSPNDRELYATSESANGGNQGSVSVISVPKAETQPEGAVLANVGAGCSPVRVAVSPDGRTLWVTARGSDALLGFSASDLTKHPKRSLVANVPVGAAPAGISLVSHGTRIVVADSNRFQTNADGALTVVDTQAALRHQPAVTETLAGALFPRDMSLRPDGELLITDYLSDEITALDTTSLH
jgi:DNA-binding beta-propeller fold protein YncE